MLLFICYFYYHPLQGTLSLSTQPSNDILMAIKIHRPVQDIIEIIARQLEIPLFELLNVSSSPLARQQIPQQNVIITETPKVVHPKRNAETPVYPNGYHRRANSVCDFPFFAQGLLISRLK